MKQMHNATHSKIGQSLTIAERDWLFQGICPDCAQLLIDQPHTENGVHIGFESDISCSLCSFKALLRKTP